MNNATKTPKFTEADRKAELAEMTTREIVSILGTCPPNLPVWQLALEEYKKRGHK